MNNIYRGTIYLLLLILNIAPVFAQQHKQEMTLKIGTMDLMPYGWIDEHSEKRGIIYTLNQEIGKRSGMQFTNEIIPFSRMLYKLREGQIDLISSQPHKEALISGDKLAIQHKVKVIAVSRKGTQIENIEDFRQKKVLYHQSASYSKLSDIPMEIFRVNNYQQMVRNLYYRSDYDVGIFSEPAFYYWVQEVGLSPDDFGKVITIESNLEQWIFVRKGLPESVKRNLESIANEIFNDGLYENLLEEMK